MTVRSFVLRYSYVHHAVIGYKVKSRAIKNYITYNRIMDERDGRGSYAIDPPGGGPSFDYRLKPGQRAQGAAAMPGAPAASSSGPPPSTNTRWEMRARRTSGPLTSARWNFGRS